MRTDLFTLGGISLLGFTALSGGCGLLLGLDEFSEGSATSTSTSSGSGSTGGSGGMGAGGATASSGGMGTGGAKCIDPVKDCPKPANECVTAICDSMGGCTTKNVDAGTVFSTQTPGDCKRVVCDGAALTKSVDDDADAPDDGNDCTVDACSNGVSAPIPAVIDTACTMAGGKFCDGASVCVECTKPSHCMSMVCQANKCVDGSCADGVQNGTETDKDCGGGGCQKCVDGLGCMNASDCISQVCDTANTKKCQSPSCTDGVRNGLEVGVDCGGPCPACGFGMPCVSGADCATGYCVNFKCDAKTLATGQLTPLDIAVDSTYVYWSTFDKTMGTIAKVPIGGGNVTTLASLQGGPRGIALDTTTNPTTVYWVNFYEGTVKKISSAGGAITTLATGQTVAMSLAVTSTTVFWTTAAGTVAKCPVGGGATILLDNSSQGGAGAINVSGSNVYWVGNAKVTNNTMVLKQPLAGGSTTQIYGGSVLGMMDMAMDLNNIYLAEGNSNQILSTGANGGAVTMVASANDPFGIALNGASLYWTNYGDGSVEKVATTGGVKTTIATGQLNPGFMAVDTTSVYWTEPGGGTIKKANK